MKLSRIYIYRPPLDSTAYAYLDECIADARSLISSEPEWAGCEVLVNYTTKELAINIATEVRRIKTSPGPVIFAGKVQHKQLTRFTELLSRVAVVYPGQGVTCGIELFQMCEIARKETLGGEPSISRRELISILIVAKLHRMEKWAGEAKNKSFLNSEDLPKGGFPKDVSKREVLDAAIVLESAGVLVSKLGDRNKKYGLGSKETVETVMANQSFAGNHIMEKWFRKDKYRVPAYLLAHTYA